MKEQGKQTVAVLRRGIPVDGCSTDTCVRVCKPDEMVAELITWANELCQGSAVLISLKLVQEGGDQ